MWLWRLVIHILFLNGGNMKTCRCADNMVNVNYERIASRDGTWFQQMTSESERNLSPPNKAVASVLTIRPWPIHKKKRLTLQLSGITRRPQLQADQSVWF